MFEDLMAKGYLHMLILHFGLTISLWVPRSGLQKLRAYQREHFSPDS
jgi:hypothetical protein